MFDVLGRRFTLSPFTFVLGTIFRILFSSLSLKTLSRMCFRGLIFFCASSAATPSPDNARGGFGSAAPSTLLVAPDEVG